MKNTYDKPSHRILFFALVELDIPGGPTVHALNLLRGFQQAKTNTLFLCPKPTKSTQEIPGKVSFIRFFGFSPFRLFLFYVLSFFILLRKIADFRPTLLYVREMEGNPFPAVASWISRVPMILEVNGPIPGPTTWRSFQLKKAKGIVFNSIGLRDQICQQFRLAPEKTAVISMHVDTERFVPMDRDECRVKLGLPLSGKFLGYVGTFQPTHEITILFSALEKLLAQGMDCRLILVGAGNLFEEYRKKVRGRTAEPFVTFTDFVPHDKVPLYINTFDLGIALLKPEKQYATEAFLKIKEYLACGLPVLVNDCNPALFREYPQGVLHRVPIGDAGEIAQRIKKVLDAPNPEALKEGRLFVQNHFGLSEAARQTLNFIATRLKES